MKTVRPEADQSVSSLPAFVRTPPCRRVFLFALGRRVSLQQGSHEKVLW